MKYEYRVKAYGSYYEAGEEVPESDPRIAAAEEVVSKEKKDEPNKKKSTKK